jgi:superfamily II DNA helicase RecQ
VGGDFGVARGVDFRGVSTVINVDLPSSVDAYVHRIGRTARGGASGVALSVVNMDDPVEKAMLTQIQEAQPMISNPDVAGKQGPLLLVYVHTNIHSYIHSYIHTFIHTYIHTYIRTYIHTYT